MVLLNCVFGLFQLLFIVYILFKEVEKKSPAMFLWATLLVMFGFPHFLTVIIHDLPYHDDVIMKASLFVTLFCILYVVVRSKKQVDFIDISNRRGFRIDNDGITYSLFETICFAIFLISALAFLMDYTQAQGGIMNTSWGGAREIKHNNLHLSQLFGILQHMLSGFSLYYFLTHRQAKAIIILLLQMGVIFITRNRVLVLPLFIFPILLYIIKMRHIRLQHFLIGIFAAVTVIYIVYAIRAFRWLGTLSNALSNVTIEYLNAMVIQFITDNNGELGLRQWFYYFIEHDNNFEGFNMMYTYIRLALVYLPARWSFGLKPESFDLYMGKAIGMATGGSMHPTLFGDCFGNLYWFGILLGVFWAIFANFFDWMISRQKHSFHKVMIFFMIAFSYVVIGRGSVYNGFFPTAWGALLLLLLGALFKSLCRVRLKIFI